MTNLISIRRDNNGDQWLYWRGWRVIGTCSTGDMRELEFADQCFAQLESDGWGHPRYTIPRNWYCQAWRCFILQEPLPPRPYCPSTIDEIIAAPPRKQYLWYNVLLKMADIPKHRWTTEHQLLSTTRRRRKGKLCSTKSAKNS